MAHLEGTQQQAKCIDTWETGSDAKRGVVIQLSDAWFVPSSMVISGSFPSFSNTEFLYVNMCINTKRIHQNVQHSWNCLTGSGVKEGVCGGAFLPGSESGLVLLILLVV